MTAGYDGNVILWDAVAHVDRWVVQISGQVPSYYKPCFFICNNKLTSAVQCQMFVVYVYFTKLDLI